MHDDALPDDDAEPDRRPYEPPVIKDLGTLHDLTRGSTGPDQDIVNVQAGQFPTS